MGNMVDEASVPQVYERVSWLARRHSERSGFQAYLEGLAATASSGKVVREELLKIFVSPTNFLCASLTLAPPRRGAKAPLFVTLHTARPKNRVNLKSVNQLDEVYALASAAQSIRHEGFRQFFQKHFGGNLEGSESKKLQALSLTRLQWRTGQHSIQEEGWTKIDVNPEGAYEPHVEVEDLASKEVPDLGFEQLEQELGQSLNKGAWEHYALYRTRTLMLVLSVTKYGTYTYGFTPGATPTNMLKFKDISLLVPLITLVSTFRATLKTHPDLERAIVDYQAECFQQHGVSGTDSGTGDPDGDAYKCLLCSAAYGSPGHLRRHMAAKHPWALSPKILSQWSREREDT
jgi:hypothetical protein